MAPPGTTSSSQNPLVDIITLAGNSGDVRIASSSESNLIYTDYSADRIGFGTNVPGAMIHIQSNGSTSATDSFLVENSSGTDLMTIRDDGFTEIAMNGAATRMGTSTNYLQQLTQITTQFSSTATFTGFESDRDGTSITMRATSNNTFIDTTKRHSV